MSAGALQRSILAAGRAQLSVHVVTVKDLGAHGIELVTDAGTADGVRRVTFRNGTTKSYATVVVDAGTAYFRGDAPTLLSFFGFANVAATRRYAGRWVEVPHSDKQYSAITEGITLGSAMDDLAIPGPLSTISERTVDGEAAVGVLAHGSDSGTPTVAALYGRAAGQPLPIEGTVRDGNEHGTITLSDWNEPIAVHVPIAVPISKTGLERK
jgi:hypothetical protein